MYIFISYLHITYRTLALETTLTCSELSECVTYTLQERPF